jgi:hypothetical protein
MKYKVRSLLAIVAVYSTAVDAGGFYLGASTGIMDTDVGGFDEATNAGILAGYDVYTKDIIAVSLEAEFTTTVSDGDVEIQGNKGDWDLDTRAAYIAFRMGQRAYLKVRYGVVHNDVTVKVAGFRRSESDTSGSWGGAIGWMFDDNWGMQVDGTMVDPDVTYWNLGVKYHF